MCEAGVRGDVVWADGLAWMREGNYRLGYVRGPWRSYTGEAMATAAFTDLACLPDFRWLVCDGHLVGPLHVSEASETMEAGRRSGPD